MSRTLLHDWEYEIERCCKENLPCEMKELIEDIYDVAFIRGKNSKETVESIPYLMHKEMDIPLLECQKAYDIAINYLRNQGKIKG